MVYHSISISSIAEAISDRDEAWLEGHAVKDFYDLES